MRPRKKVRLKKNDNDQEKKGWECALDHVIYQEKSKIKEKATTLKKKSKIKSQFFLGR